ncbi:hypothetical protein B0A49_02157 [Cryomyces minteri]|uniref:Rhomboid-type serine protease n=1 Tax=Cryomyces minteri TaxID=331657 RepID=A0A4U0X912_9PEZI|nr:hypothetical protein B0A49_02157 [Cryomyces minteri]
MANFSHPLGQRPAYSTTASQEHYNASAPSPYYGRREEAPLPPLPPLPPPSTRQTLQDTSPYYVSPVTSPFDDRAYPAYPEPSQRGYGSDTGYFGASDGHNNSHADPFSDPTAVPLRSQKPKLDASVDPAPYMPDSEDPFVRDRKATKRHRKRKGKEGWFTGKVTWVVYVLTLVQIVVFIVEIIKNSILTKSPIEIHPQFNPMIGPSPYVLINMGARYVPCMHNVAGVQTSSVAIQWPCPNTTSATSAECSLSDLCGFSGVPNPHPHGSLDDTPAPNQWFRFIVPIFLHAGIVHIGFNLLLQMTLGRDMEQEIGSVRFALVYFASGIFGFVLGGNFAATGIASTGCSGSLFGILALTLLDLLYHWRERDSPVKDLAFIGLDVVIAFVLGLLPGLDNFSHIGGFLMGLVLGICLLHSPRALRQRIGDEDERPYTGVGFGAAASQPADDAGARRSGGFVREPLRAGALVGVVAASVALLRNFYVFRTTCGWCKYLSCLPVNNWCNIGNLQFTNSTSKRDLAALGAAVFTPSAHA